MYYDLSRTTIISFESGQGCNLTREHDKCPINHRVSDRSFGPLTPKKIKKSIEEAQELGFNGYVAFHFYNEPLLYKKRILEVINNKSDCKYLLWTNGLLLSRNVEENQFLKLFSRIVITNYFPEDAQFFDEIKNYYKNVHIATWELDDRLKSYSREYVNEIGCKRILFDLPIDYYGNVHLCCKDWDNSHKIGNINESSLREVVLGDDYQTLLRHADDKLLDRETCPKVCLTCSDPWLKYPKHDFLN